MTARLFLVSTVFLLACSPQPSAATDGGQDAGSEGGVDAGLADVGHVDAGHVDGGLADAGGSAGLSPTCEGACRLVTLSAQVGGAVRGFDRVQFGFTSPQRSPRGRWELHLEAHSGGDPECPAQASPVPDRTVVVSGVTVPADLTPQTNDGGVSLVLFDFEGALTRELALRASSVTFSPTAGYLCAGCGQDAGSQEQFLSFDLSADFEDGGMSGHGFARHCSSLDDL